MCILYLEYDTPGKSARSYQCSFLKSPHGGKMRLNYQDPDAGVFSSSVYGVRGIYIYIATISDVNENSIWVIIRSRHSSTFRGVYVRSC